MAMDHAGDTLYAGTANGSLLWWRLGDDRVIDHDIVPAFVDKRAVTCMRLLLGDVTLVVGDAQGRVSNWFFVRPESDPAAAALRPGSSSRSPAARREEEVDPRPLACQPHAAGSTTSPLRRATVPCWSATPRAVATMDYTTSQRQLATLEGVKRLAFPPRGDVVLTLAGDRAAGMAHRRQFVRPGRRRRCTPRSVGSRFAGESGTKAITPRSSPGNRPAAPTTMNRN